MANYADYIQFPDTMINGNYVERYAFPDSTGMYTDSTAWYRTPEGYKVVDRSDAKLYKLDHPEGRPYVAQTYSEDERQKLFNDAFGKSKIEDVEQKSDGGILSQVPKELVELVQAAMSDESAAKKLSLLMSQRPDLTDVVEQIAAELQGTQEMKCGGRVNKKALGSKLLKTQKAKCGCELKKVGGRLIEVDSCTGLPIHRNGGMVRKYQHSAGGGITFKDGTMYNTKGDRLPDTLNAHSLKALGILNINNNPYYFNNGKLYTQESKIGSAVNSYGWAEADLNNIDLSVLNSLNLRKFNFGSAERPEWQYYQTNKDGSLSKYGDANNTRYYFAKGNDGKSRMYSDFGASDATWDSKNLVWSREGFNYTPGKGWSAIEPEQPAGEKPQKDPVKTWRDTFGTGKTGKFGGKTYDEALALQNEMLNADWFDANLGTSGINKNGADGMWGATSQKEYTRYLAEKQRREDQAAAAEAERQELNNLQASSIRRTTSDGMTNEALLAMDAGKAMSTLSRPDYERWMKLNQYQQGRNAALVYNGKRYNDETAYNAAVDAETARTAPKLDMESLLNIRGRRKRNNAYTQYQASMDKHVANNPLYSGPKALTQEQLSATSFKNGGQLNYANYLN